VVKTNIVPSYVKIIIYRFILIIKETQDIKHEVNHIITRKKARQKGLREKKNMFEY